MPSVRSFGWDTWASVVRSVEAVSVDGTFSTVRLERVVPSSRGKGVLLSSTRIVVLVLSCSAEVVVRTSSVVVVGFLVPSSVVRFAGT